MRTIVIDAGHGGNDRSNIGYSGKYIEADGNLEFALKLQKYLNSFFDVKMTRVKDKSISLRERGTMFKGDLFISIHSDAFNKSTAHGVTVFYSIDLPESKKLAEKIGHIISKSMNIRFRRSTYLESTISKGEDKFVVIDSAQDNGFKQVFLIERGFHTNPEEEQLLLDEKVSDKTAKALANLLIEHFRKGKVMNNEIVSKEVKKELNIDSWLKAGLTGKDVNVKVLEFLYHVSGIGPISKDGPPDFISLKHGQQVESIIKDIAVNCNTEILDYCQDNFKLRPELFNISLTGLTNTKKDDLALNEAMNEGATVIVAGGNSGADARHPRTLAGMNTGISVGAIHKNLKLKDYVEIIKNFKNSVLAWYSSRGKFIDVVSYSAHNDFSNSGKKLFGTSFASPVVVGMLALWFEFYKNYFNKYPTHSQSVKFLIENCKDVFEKGRDDKSGFGVFVLPDIYKLKKVYEKQVVEKANREKDKADVWAEDAQKWVIENKLSDGTRPTDGVQRQEDWTVLFRFYNKFIK